MEILSKFKQTKATHILDHIHEWQCHRWLVKNYVSEQLLVEWFITSLFPSITEYVAKG